MERRSMLAASFAAGATLLPGCGGGVQAGIDSLEPSASSQLFTSSISAASLSSLHTPLLEGKGAGTVVVNGRLAAASLQPIGIRFTVNPGDDVVAATRLLYGGADVFTLNPGDSLDVSVSADIVAVYFVGLGAGPVPTSYDGGAYIVSQSETDISDALRNQARLTFAEPSVRRLRLVLSGIYDGYALTVSITGGVSA